MTNLTEDAEIMRASATVRPEVLLQQVWDGASTLFNTRIESGVGIDRIGTRRIRALIDAPSVEAACEALEREYEADPEWLFHDVRAFVLKQVDRGLLEFAAA